jgi:hypothetical protein
MAAKSRMGKGQMDSRFNTVKARFAEEIRRRQVEVHRAYSSDAAHKFPNDYFDWVNIDGNHLHDFVKKDLELFYVKVRPC